VHLIRNLEFWNFKEKVSTHSVGMYKKGRAPLSVDPILTMDSTEELRQGSCIAVTSNDMYGKFEVRQVNLDESSNVLKLEVEIADPGRNAIRLQRLESVGVYFHLKGVTLPSESTVRATITKLF
jgi:hypothetical protein